jgi:predicted P-loop ATPase
MNADIISRTKLAEVTKENPCPHCGKSDWCYRIAELTVCNRDAEPALGWQRTSKTDRNGKPYYAPATQEKQVHPQGKTEYVYHSRDGQPLVKVTRIDDGNGKKKIFQSHWDGKNWVKGLTEEIKKAIPIYRYGEVKQAISSSKPIFIVEGEGVADKLWALGLAATTTIGGAGKYRAYGSSQQDLEGATLVLCPDRDTPGLAHMEDINKDFPDAKWLYAPPSDFYWTHLPKTGGLDIKDWIESGATTENILQAIEDRRVVVEFLEETFSLDPARESRPTGSKHEQNFNIIRIVWGSKLRWNTLKKQVELDGKRLPLDRIKIKIAREIHIDISREDAREIVLELAHENSYSPVVEYLKRVALLHPTAVPKILDEMASKYFGTTDPLHAALMRRTMIAAVARAFDPGCKHDNITILQGDQGLLKSTFWETLVGREYFTDDIASGTEKDEIIKLSQYWLLEYAEFETAYRKKEVSQLKAFLSRRSDSIRRPYATDVEDVPRPSIFVGTTNKTEFLYDPTGERRYHVIPVLKEIDIALLKQERDLLWAAAVHAYRSGEQWHLTKEEDEALKAANKQYQATDSWEEAIASYLATRSFTVVGDILTEVLKLELAKQDRASEMRVAEVLRRLGWEKSKQRRINGKPRWVWEPKATEVVTPSNPDTASALSPMAQQLTNQAIFEVVTPSNPDIASASQINLNLSQPIEQNFSKLESKEIISPPPLIQESLKTSCDTETSPNPKTQLKQHLESANGSVTTPSTVVGTGVSEAEKSATPEFELTQPVVATSKASEKVVETSPSATTPSLVIGVGQRVDYCGEEVTIVGWENGGSKVQVEFSNGRFQTVRKGTLKPKGFKVP